MSMLNGQPTACGCSTERRTVIDYVLNPCRRAEGELGGTAGDVVEAGGVRIQVAAEIVDGVVRDVCYRASSCATLTAYAELLGDLVVGRPVREVAALPPDRLVDSLPGVPAARRDRAVLVARAWWSAVGRSEGSRSST